MNNRRVKIFGEIVIFFVLLAFLFFATQLGLLSSVSNEFDFNVFQWQENPPREDIVIVAFDDKTLNEADLRYQDMSRSDFADVIENIFLGNPRVVGVDVFFNKPASNIEEDERLAKLFENHRNLVTGIEFFEGDFLLPADTLNISLDQLGYVGLSTSVSEDALINRVPLISKKNNPNSIEYEPFVFRIYRALKTGRQEAEYNKEQNYYTIIRGGEETMIPLQNGGVNINFYGPRRSYDWVSFSDVMDAKINLNTFKDKIVLLGYTAHDNHDEFITPTSRVINHEGENEQPHVPGVEIHANLLQTVLDQDFIYYQTPLEKFQWAGVFLMVLFIVFLFASFWTSSLVLALALLVAYANAVFQFRLNGIVFSFFWPMLGAVLLWAFIYVWRFIMAEKMRSQIQNTFSRYVSEDIVHEILKSPDKVNLGGEEREITVFFCDIKSFTELAEKLPVEKVLEFINLYLSHVSKAILKEKGTIDKFIGDAVMAFWGAPLTIEDHAVRACRVALNQKETLSDLNKKMFEKALPEIDFRIGINTGVAVIGNVGTEERLSYTALGDTVNLASRLEGAGKEYGTELLISESTYNQVKDVFLCREIDLIRVKGRKHPVKIYELLAENEKAGENEKAIKEVYEKGLEFYRKKEWESACDEFKKLASDPVSKKMRDRIEHLRKIELEEDWDGVFIFHNK